MHQVNTHRATCCIVILVAFWSSAVVVGQSKAIAHQVAGGAMTEETAPRRFIGIDAVQSEQNYELRCRGGSALRIVMSDVLERSRAMYAALNSYADTGVVIFRTGPQSYIQGPTGAHGSFLIGKKQ